MKQSRQLTIQDALADDDSDAYCKLNLYSFFDVRSRKYSQPFIANTDDEAMRVMTVMITLGGDNILSQFPDEHQLWHLGMFNISTGEIYSCPANLVCDGSMLLSEYNKRLAHMKSLSSIPSQSDNIPSQSDNSTP